MSAVTVDRAVAQLSTAVEDLWSAVGELVLIVLEDQPRGEGLAVADDLVETVSEIQGAVAEARAGLAACRTPAGSVAGVTVLPEVAVHLQAASLRYWRDVRGHAPVAQLRAGARARGGEWSGWRRSVEQSAERCAEPLDAVASAVTAGWQEISRLVPPPPHPHRWPSTAGPPDPRNSAHSPDQPRSAP